MLIPPQKANDSERTRPRAPANNGSDCDRNYRSQPLAALVASYHWELTISPVVGLRMTGAKCGLVWKSSTPPGASRLPEIAS
jgi:hypothetical protein